MSGNGEPKTGKQPTSSQPRSRRKLRWEQTRIAAGQGGSAQLTVKPHKVRRGFYGAVAVVVCRPNCGDKTARVWSCSMQTGSRAGLIEHQPAAYDVARPDHIDGCLDIRICSAIVQPRS